MNQVSSIASAVAAVAVVAIIAWGVNSCSQQETAIREACIKAGGSVVTTPSSSHCIRGSHGPA